MLGGWREAPQVNFFGTGNDSDQDARSIGHVDVGAAIPVVHDGQLSGHGPLAHTKMLSGRKAETIQLGASTISLILRSTATLDTMYASSRERPRSSTRWSII